MRSLASDPLRQALRTLWGLIPLAPRGVEAALIPILRQDLLAPVRAEAEALAVAAASPLQRPPGASCPFPVVSRGAPIAGGVFYALAGSPRPLSACPIDRAFAGEVEMRWLLGALSADSLSVLPNPLTTDTQGLELLGGSSGGAFALAAEASRRGVAVPDDVVVSATVLQGSDGALHLGPVDGLEEKVQVLERELPGCRFFFVPPAGGPALASTVIELHPLAPSPLQALADSLLPPRAAPERWEIYTEVREAEAAFHDQAYPASGRRWQRVLDALDATGLRGDEPTRWRHAASTRLGAIALHAGQTELADRWFERAKQTASRVSLLEADELRLQIAGAHLDHLDPGAAAAILLPLVGGWRERMAAESEGDDRRRVWIGCLGGLRRLHLLLGEEGNAVEVQRELLRWSPEPERARTLGDLGECLRRLGRHDEAAASLAEGWRALRGIHLPTYRLQTEAFLTVFLGRLALDRGEAVDRERLLGLHGSLPDRSAARWRLLQLHHHAGLRQGEAGAWEALVEALEASQGTFLRWQAMLGLLRGALVAPDPMPLLAAAAPKMEALAPCTDRFPRVDGLRREFVARAQAGERDALPALARQLLRLTA